MRLILFCLGTVLLVGCKEVKTPDGQIPTEYVESAKQVEGIYDGQFEGVAGRLTIHFEGRTPRLSYQNAYGSDLLNPSCHSEFGKIMNFQVSEEGSSYQLDYAFFEFDPMLCKYQVSGDKVRLSFSSDAHTVKLSVLKETQREEYEECQADRRGFVRCERRIRVTPIYLNGQFKRR